MSLAPVQLPQGQRQLSGQCWSATIGGRVGFEPWLECNQPMAIDFEPAVAGIASQPFWLYWTDRNGERVSHAPDYFARREDGPAVVIDCRPADATLPDDASTRECQWLFPSSPYW